MKKSKLENNGQSPIQLILVVLLVVAAFFIGYLWNKVKTMEEVGGGGGNAGNGAANAPSPSAQPSGGATASSVASKIGLDESEFQNCLNSEEAAQTVEDQATTGIDSGVRGTPGNIVLDNQTGSAWLIPGALPFTDFTDILDSVLAGESPANQQEASDVTPIQDYDYVRGDSNARITLIEYSDYDCPFCSRFHPTAQQLVDEYNGQLSWVYRQFPLDSIHPNAREKSIGAICAGSIGGGDAFWAYTDAMFE